MNSIICPISSEKIDNNESRITVFISALLMMAFFFTKNPIYMWFATGDTLIRAVFSSRYSPIKNIASGILRFVKIDEAKVDKAKKVFASRLGMICGLASLVLFHMDLEFASFIIGGFWMFLALLDSLLDFCMGCIIYTYIVLPMHLKK